MQRWGLNTYILDDAMKTSDSSNILRAIDELEKRVENAKQEYKAFINDANEAVKEARKYKIDVSDMLQLIATITGDKREWIMSKASCKDTLVKFQQEIQKAVDAAKGKSGKDIPHRAVKTDYKTDADVDETFKSINAEFTTDKWFANGDLKLSPTTRRGVNGDTYMDGRIRLTPDRLQRVKSALAKIGQGKSDTITDLEADAMATLWHEITHNRNVPGNMYTTSIQTDVME